MNPSKINWKTWEEVCTFMRECTFTMAEHDGLTDIEAKMVNNSLLTMQTSIKLIGLVLQAARARELKVRERTKKPPIKHEDQALTLKILEGMSKAKSGREKP